MPQFLETRQNLQISVYRILAQLIYTSAERELELA